MNFLLPYFKSYTEIRCPIILSKRVIFIWKSCKTKTLFRCKVTLSSPQNVKRPVVIGTHDGRFHCDEVFACWMLKQLPQYKDAEIIRTRDQSKLDLCDVVVDVGGVYDPSRNRYDHHQSTFNGTMNNIAGWKWNTKLSSCGLIYLHKGRELISHLSQLPYDHANVVLFYCKLYAGLIEEIDAVDNGIEQKQGKPRYLVTTTLASRVARLNPSWNETKPDYESAFSKAMQICGDEFKERLIYYSEMWFPARHIVEQAIKERHLVDLSGEIIVLKSSCPWEEHLFDIERELDIVGQIKFVLYEGDHWGVCAVRLKPGMFESRHSLLQQWCGLSGDNLSEVSGIPNCVFVHMNGFIGRNKDYSGALEMARVSLRSAR